MSQIRFSCGETLAMLGALGAGLDEVHKNTEAQIEEQTGHRSSTQLAVVASAICADGHPHFILTAAIEPAELEALLERALESVRARRQVEFIVEDDEPEPKGGSN